MPSKSKAQHDLMQAAAYNATFAAQAGIDQDVAKEFIQADKEAGLWQSEDTDDKKEGGE